MESALKAVETRRNKTLAHLDPMVVSNPVKVAENSVITVDDLQRIFAFAWQVLNGVSTPYWDTSFSYQLIGVDDYEAVLDWIVSGKKRQREQYKAEFGPFPSEL